VEVWANNRDLLKVAKQPMANTIQRYITVKNFTVIYCCYSIVRLLFIWR